MVDWFAAHKTATPDLAQRAVGAVLSPAAGADGYKAGDTVTLQLSSLAFTAGEKAPGDVSVSLGGTALATSAVDPAMTLDAFDEAGKATLTFTIPQGVSGAQALHVAVAGTGTAVDLPITIAGQTGPFQGTIQVGGDGKVQAGSALAIRGAHFTPGQTVTLELRGKKGVVVALGTAKVGADGAFTAAPVVPKSTQPDKYTLAVTQADGNAVTTTVHVSRGNGHSGGVIGSILGWLWNLLKGLFG